MTEKPKYYSRSDLVLETIGIGHWWNNPQIQLMTRGVYTPRHRPTEVVLKRKSDSGLLRTAQYGHQKVYALASKTKNFHLGDDPKIYHGLSSIETMIRFYFAKRGEILAERRFRGCGSVPDGGIKYPNKKMLLFEFSTRDNVQQRVKSKFTAYERYLDDIEEKFDAKAVVVFVLDIRREEVKEVVREWKPTGPLYFIDYETFYGLPLGGALQAPLYFSTDGQEYSLNK